MKKIVTVLATVAVAVGLTAGSAAAKPQADPPGLKTPGQLTVGLSMPSPGFQNVTPLPSGNNVLPASSAPKGMEIEMVNAIAKALGIKKIVYIQNNFQNMYLPGPKKWDFGLAEMTITAERKKNIDFSVPYINANQGVMIRKGLSPAPKYVRRSQGHRPLRADRHHGRGLHQGPRAAQQEGAVPADDDDHVPAAQEQAL